LTDTLTFDIVQYLANKGIRTYPTGKQTEVTAHCWSCDDGNPKGKGKLYINTVDGWFHCKRCGFQGGTYVLQESLGDDPRKARERSPDPSVRRRILNWAADVGAAMLSNNDEHMLYLVGEKRGLWPETIVDRKLGFIGNDWSLVQSLPEEFSRDELKTTGLVHRDGLREGKDFFYNHLLIPYISRGSVVQIRGRHVAEGKGGKYMTGPGEDVRLYNLDDLDDADEVIITEGEFDALILKQIFSLSPEARVQRIAVVGVPGAGAFKEEFARYFDDVKRVYVGFDSDDEGRKGALRIKDLIGTRTRIIEWPKHLVDQAFQMHLKKLDWSDFANKMGGQWQDVLELMSTAGGKRLFSMREAGVSFRNAKNLSDGIKTGFSQLDATIAPGLLPGQVMVILAKTGTGKTIVCCNMAYYMRERRVLFISLEQTREEVYDRLRRIYLFWHPNATDEVIEHELRNIYICDENRLSEKDLGTLISEYEVETGERPDVVYVDYLGYFARGVRGSSPYERVTNAVMQLKADAKGQRVVIISPSQVNRIAKEGKPIDLDDARDSGAIEETADFLLSVFKPDDAVDNTEGSFVPSGRLRMGTLKSRHGGKDRVFSLQMDHLTLAIVDAESPAAKRAQEHNFKYGRGYTWDQLRVAQMAPVQEALVP
jgi:archaellum biogenesis ATPase FlaH